jgi:hypothetical protein
MYRLQNKGIQQTNAIKNKRSHVSFTFFAVETCIVRIQIYWVVLNEGHEKDEVNVEYGRNRVTSK